VSWEWQNGRLVYTRTRKLGGGVIRREYFGSGARAEAAAAEDQAVRQARAAELAQRREEAAQWAEAAASFREFHALTDLLLAATLLAEGFHRHAGGHWRLRLE
jgi:hypothetical protein